MITHSGGITVNAAFLREVKEDNTHLRELLTAVADALARLPHRIRPQVLAELLGRLRDQLATHFSLEEFFGYFDDAVDVAPHLSSRADALRAEHDTLFVQLCDIVEQCEQLVYGEAPSAAVRQIAKRFQVFHEQLEEHEAGEAELIMDALYQDIGVGD